MCTLHQSAFDSACAELMRLVEVDYAPILVVGIRTGGLVVAQSMIRAASTPLPVLALTCRRELTKVKSRLKRCARCCLHCHSRLQICFATSSTG